MADKRVKMFSLKRDWPLRKIAEHAEIIKRKRCSAICKTIIKQAKIELNFDFEDEELDDEPDMLQVVPCGLFCGK